MGKAEKVKARSALSKADFVRLAARSASVPERVQIGHRQFVDGAVAALVVLTLRGFDFESLDGEVVIHEAAEILKGARELHSQWDGETMVSEPVEKKMFPSVHGMYEEGFTPHFSYGRFIGSERDRDELSRDVAEYERKHKDFLEAMRKVERKHAVLWKLAEFRYRETKDSGVRDRIKKILEDIEDRYDIVQLRGPQAYHDAVAGLPSAAGYDLAFFSYVENLDPPSVVEKARRDDKEQEAEWRANHQAAWFTAPQPAAAQPTPQAEAAEADEADEADEPEIHIALAKTGESGE